MTNPVNRIINLSKFFLGDKLFMVYLAGLIIQGGHTVEHFVQVFQRFFLGLPPAESHGLLSVIGADIPLEPLHFYFNWSVMAFLLFIHFGFKLHKKGTRYRNIPLLHKISLSVLIVQGYHTLEHSVRYVQWLSNGIEPAPGLVGAPILNAFGVDGIILFHFWINMVVYPLMIAFLLIYVSEAKVIPIYSRTMAKRQLKSILDSAEADGIITDDEAELIKQIEADTTSFDEELEKAIEDGETLEQLKSRLSSVKEKIINNAIKTAELDGVISEEEQELIKRLKEANQIDEISDKLEEMYALQKK